MSLFRRPPAESGPIIYRPSEVAAETSARHYRTLAVDPTPASAVATELSALTRANRRRGSILTFLVSVAAIGSFCGVVWWAHNQNLAAGGDGLTPIIKADERPTRERPANAGGMKFAGQDNQAYERINPKAAPNPPEKLLTAPQQPKPPTPQQLTTPPESAALPQTAAAQGEPVPAKAAAEDAPAGPTIATILEQVSGPAGGWRIQVASEKTEEQARTTWARLQGAHGEVFSSLRMQAARTDLGNRGVFYRVQAGPLDEKQALATCARLKQRNVDCLPVPPAKSGG